MKKYYRVKKDTFIWEKGAILHQEGSGYVAVEDVWNTVNIENEYISSSIIESQPDWFERVYESKTEKALFVTADGLKKAYTSMIQ